MNWQWKPESGDCDEFQQGGHPNDWYKSKSGLESKNLFSIHESMDYIRGYLLGLSHGTTAAAVTTNENIKISFFSRE